MLSQKITQQITQLVPIFSWVLILEYVVLFTHLELVDQSFTIIKYGGIFLLLIRE